MSRPTSDPFVAGPGSSVAYHEDLNVAQPGRIGSPGMASTGVAGTAPQLSASRNSGRTGAQSSAYSKSAYPWYLQTKWIVALILLLLLALGLGLGLGLGLRDNNSSASAAADNAGNTSTTRVQSTVEVETTESDGVTIVPSMVSRSGSAGTSYLISTVGGQTVTAPVVTVSAATSQVMITVSETVDPSTSTRVATRTVVAGTQTITSVLGGGGGTTTIMRTVIQTITGAANRVKARRLATELDN